MIPNDRSHCPINQVRLLSKGQATDILIHAEEIQKLKKQLNQIYAKHTKKPLAEIGNHGNLQPSLSLSSPVVQFTPFSVFPLSEAAMERDKFMSPAEALEFGIIDKILTHPDSEPAAKPESRKTE